MTPRTVLSALSRAASAIDAMLPAWAPWALIAAMGVALAIASRGCSSARVSLAYYRTAAQQSADRLAGADVNLRAIELAVKNKDRRIADLESTVLRSSCEGTRIDRFGVDGRLVERRCEGKSTDESTVTRTRTGEDTTPTIAPPYIPPPPVLPPPAVTGSSALWGWAVHAGAGVSLDPLRAPVYFAMIERRLFGPVSASAWGHFPALAGGVAVGGRW